MKRQFLTVALGMLVSTSAMAGGTVSGTIKYDGQVPPMKTIKMSADAKCEAKHTEPVTAEALVLGEGNTLANIFVRVKSGLPEGKTYETPAEPTVLNQLGCMYVPHVIAVQKDQPVKILNSDGTLHNVHGLPTKNAEFNVAMPAFKKEISKTFDQVEDPFKVKCDVHPWMGGYIAVMDNPFFDVTAQDGKFEIKDLPAGDYEIEFWQEKLGTQVQKVTVADGATQTLDVTMTRPETVGQLNFIVIEN
ncbi:MAG: carboxypeptidase regulatory-like domain-containing protein [Deltaproteobacteria bacterium]|nr:carboxypeptidase regulatory-like domain-containing protein [Deltaproteobacteria bacterium]